jgi:hypothetical protein
MNERPKPASQSLKRAHFARPRSARSLALRLGAVGGALPALLAAQAQQAVLTAAPGGGETVATTVSVGAKEGYDSNVFMQSQGPLANRDSMVTTITPFLGLKWRPSAGFWLDGSYAPELASYTSDHTEDYVSHKAALNFGGNAGTGKWETANSINWVEGDSKGPTFYWAGPVAAGIVPVPALGGFRCATGATK